MVSTTIQIIVSYLEEVKVDMISLFDFSDSFVSETQHKKHNITQHIKRFFEKLKLYNNSSKNIHFKKGSIVYVNFGINIGSEINGIRPAICIKDTTYSYGDDIVVLPITSFEKNKSIDMFDIILHNYPKSGLKKKSIIKVRQIRVISKKRIRNYIGSIDSQTILQIEENIKKIFGIKKTSTPPERGGRQASHREVHLVK